VCYLTGDFARGKDSQVIELILVGADIDREYLARKIVQAEDMVGRKVSYIVLEPDEAKNHLAHFKPADLLPLWNCNEQELLKDPLLGGGGVGYFNGKTA
jgi:hypothetical protein